MADVHAVSFVDGLAFGALIFIVSVGLSLILGVLDVLNLAHGSLYLAGAYIAWRFNDAGPSWTGFLLAIGCAVAVGVVGGAVLAAMTAPLARRGHLDQALLTLGVAIVATEGLTTLFGDEPRDVAAPFGSTQLFGLTYPVYRLVLLGVGLLLALVLYLVVERTPLGALVRATAADRQMVAALGIDARKVVVGVFALGAALAAFGGVLGSPIFGASTGKGTLVLLTSLVAVVIGGLRSIPGALAGAMVVGEIQTLGATVLPDQSSFLLFAAMAVVLIARPNGLIVRRGGAES